MPDEKEALQVSSDHNTFFWLLLTFAGRQQTGLVNANFLVNPFPSIQVSLTYPENETYSSNNLTIEFTVNIPPWYTGEVYKRTEYPYEIGKYCLDGNTHYINTKIATLPDHNDSFSIRLTGLSDGSHYVILTAYALYGGDAESQRSDTSGQVFFTIGNRVANSPQPSPYLNLSLAPTLSASLAESASSVYLGSPVNFTVTASGGVEPYTYIWTLDNQTVENASGRTFILTSQAVGEHHVYASVTDANGNTATTLEVAFTVMPNPSATPQPSPSPSPSVPETQTWIILPLTTVASLLLVCFCVRRRKP